MNTVYEKHNYKDTAFPIFFHLDRRKEQEPLFPHWHEHVELLYAVEGTCVIWANGIRICADPGQVIVITPNCVHDIAAEGEFCTYYCITADKGFCDSFGVPACSGQFAFISGDSTITDCYKDIIDVMQRQPEYYRIEAKALVLRLLTLCCRAAEQTDQPEQTTPHSRMVIRAIDYLNAHCCEPVTVDELCEYLGFSKYYLCRCFKLMTGRTIVDYLNFLRCANARRLICSGQYNISESARLSGFNNMSYFSRTYQRQMGCRPSQSRSEAGY